MRILLRIAILSVLLCACSREPVLTSDKSYGRDGDKKWIETSIGKLRVQAYRSAMLSPHPSLVVVLHGDIFDPTPSYQYAFAQIVAQGIDAPVLPSDVRARLNNTLPQLDLIAIGMLRPGYEDNFGDRSDGVRGNAALDNFTPEVVDAISEAIASLKSEYSPRRVVLVGHSGGATIAALILGRHPELADAALLVACSCDPTAIRQRIAKVRSSPIWKGATRSLQPLAEVDRVRKDVTVRMIVGQDDDTAPPQYSQAYADALRKQHIDVHLVVAPGLGHNIMLTPVVFQELALLLTR
jgi:pimeloyl-ACP methyl ester carboxylesterase